MARPSRFSPRSEPHEALEERTVCREELVASMVRGVADAVRAGQARFDLVLGPRGAGKSHVLGLIEGRLRKELEGKAIVAGLPEDFHPSSLIHVLAEILRSLPSDPEVGPVERQFAILAGSEPEEARERAVGLIRARLGVRPLVIVLENLDVILAAIGREGQHQLRSILQTERRWSIVATARSQSPAFSKESEPFFGTFILHSLEPLSADGCRAMLVCLAHACGREELAEELNTARGLARVQTLRHVLGGYPRAMAFIFPHLHHDRPDTVENALGDLAEELTPYFQEQMSRLPPGQRPIVELLAEHWGPLSVTEIANATFNAQAATSTYLRRLRDDSIVRCIKLGREHFYEISEPLFRIARAMKRNDLRASTFLRILQGWYEFRGVEPWRLSPEQSTAIVIRSLLHGHNEYLENGLESAFQMLQGGRHREAFDAASALDTDHPRRVAYQIVACSCMGEDEKAFEILSSRRLSYVSVIGEVATTASSLPALIGERVRTTSSDQPLLALRFCSAIVAIQMKLGLKKSPTPSEFADLERSLRADSSPIRAIASECLVDLMIPAELAGRHEFEAYGRFVALLAPGTSEALSFNLAIIVFRAWATEHLADVIREPRMTNETFLKSLSPMARAGMLLAIGGPGETLVEAVLGEVARQEDVGLSRLSIVDRLWSRVISALMLPFFAMASEWHQLEDHLGKLSPELLLALSDAVHEGTLCAIAADRDLTPLLSLEKRLVHKLGMDRAVVTTPDATVAYVRLARPERAMVRHLAMFFGLEERLATLRALSNENDELDNDG